MVKPVLFLLLLNYSLLFGSSTSAYLNNNQSTWLPDSSNEKQSLSYLWGNIGFGGSSAIEGSISAGGSLTYQKDFFTAAARIIYMEEFQFCMFGNCASPDNIVEFAGLLGISNKSKYFLTSFGMGLSYIFTEVRRWNDEYSRYTVFASNRFGLALESQLFWTFGRSLGIGVYGFANVNKDFSYAGAMLCLQIGRLR